MNHSRGPSPSSSSSLSSSPADLQRLDRLVQDSNAGRYPAMTGFVDGGYRRLGEMLRSGSPPDATVQRFLDELPLMHDYVGTSYRVSQISRALLDTLRGDPLRHVVDRGVQSAFVLPCHAAAWAAHASAPPLRDGACRLFSIFDESVPQKNLSTARLADHVVVPPGTPLRLKAWRMVAAGPDGTRAVAHVVAHFALAGPSCHAPYDLHGGGEPHG